MATELLALEEAKSHLRVFHNMEDVDIASKVLAATEYVEKWIEVAILDVEVVFDYSGRLPVGDNYLDLPDRVPDSVVVTATYWTSNADISEDPDGVLNIRRVLLTRDGRLRIYANWDVDKHSTLPVQFSYQLGIDANKIPTAWKEAAKLVLSSLYDGRTDVESGPHFRAAKSLLDPWMKYV